MRDFILGNVRVPEQVLGDLNAQVTANTVCARRLGEFLEDSDMVDLTALSSALLSRADVAMRKAIEQVPDGVYRAAIDADGFDEDETHIECAVTVDGEQLHIDYAGTSAQIGRGLNCVMNYTLAYSTYPVKCMLDPDTPRNEGSYRPITVSAPEGSILNPTYPAPCNARQLTGHLLAGVIYKALAEAIPDQVIAECGGAPTMRAVFSGYGEGGVRFSQILFASGGMGASTRADGLPTTAFPTNAGAGSIEAFESVSPLIVWKKELRQDSGGPGEFRGGLGQECVIQSRSSRPMQLSLLSDRWKHPASGMLGGGAGACSEIRFEDGRVPHPKSRTRMEPGERITLRYAGGGGCGDPQQRQPRRSGVGSRQRLHQRGSPRRPTTDWRDHGRWNRRRHRRGGNLHGSSCWWTRARARCIRESCSPRRGTLTTPSSPGCNGCWTTAAWTGRVSTGWCTARPWSPTPSSNGAARRWVSSPPPDSVTAWRWAARSATTSTTCSWSRRRPWCRAACATRWRDACRPQGEELEAVRREGVPRRRGAGWWRWRASRRSP